MRLTGAQEAAAAPPQVQLTALQLRLKALLFPVAQQLPEANHRDGTARLAADVAHFVVRLRPRRLNQFESSRLLTSMKRLGPVTQPKRKPGVNILETVSKRKTKPQLFSK